ncbi:DUF6274 family protein [Streptomyces sp. NPDC058308]|uniref:DUF6274 family protein n=1 Tax=Streptomyces sp. NPDC058308 TaxID=3346440 RepID=UPI0036E85FA7
MSASSPPARHETRALLRAHLAAATSYRHLTRHCPICHRLLRLALEPSQPAQDERRAPEAVFCAEDAAEGESGAAPGAASGDEGSEDESPPGA